MSPARVITADEDKEDQNLDLTLRPKTLAEFIGQGKVKRNLEIFMKAAKQRDEPLEHVLLHGPPGIGKTTLAHIIAHEMGVNCRVTSGPAIEKAGDLGAILTNLEDGDILFIDEIHRLNRVVEEIFYPAMEDYALDIVVGKGPSARTLRLDLPKFTLVGATTRVHLLSSPLRDRFGTVYRLDFYEEEDIRKIVERSAKILKIKVHGDALHEIAKRARRTPRVANRLLKRVRDYAQVKGDGTVSPAIAAEALKELEIDRQGLDDIDRKILSIIIEKFGGGPVGLTTIAAAISEDQSTLEDVYEPYLMQIGLLARTPRGRVVTESGYKHLGKEAPASLQSKLV
ncbi:MAG: Holliday junction branch migration DNA helicase RuvB [Patescibacteria group bacterium]|nr:Holliday junction branch migration DNA helicase RuvB [Patescibacteria group bacterium]MDD5715659.1 Holliday junction branch migration DNA helicase RuvB [Patescibacteria group bacterium]